MILLTKEQLDKMISHSLKEAPAEACGLLAGERNIVKKVFPMTNVEHSGTKYLVNPKEQFSVFKQIREEELDLLGIYHSHPESEPYPSKTDCELATYEVAYFIVSLQNGEPVVKAFIIQDGIISEENFKISK